MIYKKLLILNQNHFFNFIDDKLHLEKMMLNLKRNFKKLGIYDDNKV